MIVVEKAQTTLLIRPLFVDYLTPGPGVLEFEVIMRHWTAEHSNFGNPSFYDV